MYIRACLVALTLLVTAFAGAARASHYALADVPRLVKPGEVEKLKKASISTTEELLAKSAKAKDRKALAKSSGLSGSLVMNGGAYASTTTMSNCHRGSEVRWESDAVPQRWSVGPAPSASPVACRFDANLNPSRQGTVRTRHCRS